MNTNEIKKALYREKPMASYAHDAYGKYAVYLADTSLGRVKFFIPFDESKELNEGEPAQLLIRWLHDR